MLADNISNGADPDWIELYQSWERAWVGAAEASSPSQALIKALDLDSPALCARALSLGALEELAAKDEDEAAEAGFFWIDAEVADKARSRAACMALQSASKRSASRCAKLLVEAAAGCASFGAALSDVISREQVDIARAMLAAAPEAARVRNCRGNTPLVAACAVEDPQARRELFLELLPRSDAFAVDGEGEGALERAAQAGFVEGVRELLALGPSLAARDQALARASMYSRRECVEALLQERAGRPVRPTWNLTPLEWAVDNAGAPGWLDVAMMLLATEAPGRRASAGKDAFDRLLERAADEERRGDPRWMGEDADWEKAARAFIQAGWMGLDGQGGLRRASMAAQSRRLGLLREVVEGWMPTKLAGLRSGKTPLMSAAESGWVQGVQMLLDRGEDPNERDGQGMRAIDWALCSSAGSACVDLLMPLTLLGDWDGCDLSLARRVAERSADLDKAAKILKGFARAKGSSGLVQEAFEAGELRALGAWLELEGLMDLGADGLGALDVACAVDFSKRFHDDAMRLILAHARARGFKPTNNVFRRPALIRFAMSCDDRASFEEFGPQLVELCDPAAIDVTGRSAGDWLDRRGQEDWRSWLDAWALAKAEREALESCSQPQGALAKKGAGGRL